MAEDCIASEETRGKVSGYRNQPGCRCWKCSTAHYVSCACWRMANLEKRRDSARKRYAKNPDKERERCRRWREKNPDKKRELDRKWREGNPEYNSDPIRMSRDNRLARQRRVERQLAQLGVEGYT